jgi:hypothetical protein
MSGCTLRVGAVCVQHYGQSRLTFSCAFPQCHVHYVYLSGQMDVRPRSDRHPAPQRTRGRSAEPCTDARQRTLTEQCHGIESLHGRLHRCISGANSQCVTYQFSTMMCSETSLIYDVVRHCCEPCSWGPDPCAAGSVAYRHGPSYLDPQISFCISKQLLGEHAARKH